MLINDAIKKVRTTLGLSQQVFATKIGISTRGLANYENDHVPPLIVLAKIQEIASECDLAWPDSYEIGQAFLDALRKEPQKLLAFARPRIKHNSGCEISQHPPQATEGLMITTLRSSEEYAYAAAFLCALEGLRRGRDHDLGSAALNAMFGRAKELMEPEESIRLDGLLHERKLAEEAGRQETRRLEEEADREADLLEESAEEES